MVGDFGVSGFHPYMHSLVHLVLPWVEGDIPQISLLFFFLGTGIYPTFEVPTSGAWK